MPENKSVPLKMCVRMSVISDRACAFLDSLASTRFCKCLRSLARHSLITMKVNECTFTKSQFVIVPSSSIQAHDIARFGPLKSGAQRYVSFLDFRCPLSAPRHLKIVSRTDVKLSTPSLLSSVRFRCQSVNSWPARAGENTTKHERFYVAGRLLE